MSIPNYQSVVADLAQRYPQEWAQAHTGGPQTEAFIRRLAWTLYQTDPRVGLNGKRGNPNDISDDVLNYAGVASGGDYDPTRNNAPCTVIDVIGGAGGPNPVPTWNHPLTPAAAAWVQPQAVEDGDGPVDPPSPPTCGWDDATITALADAVGDVQAALDAVQDELASQRELAVNLALAVKDIRAALSNGLAVEGQGQTRYIGTTTFRGVAKG